ncbi:hypothetical protein SK128_013378 [Halocaridina rubra]|uniref:Uncharacterized protein n=1 Tax=Halocaridina rubra TaxID=373956 RepID=A0AAN8XFK6_HALRR
MPVTTTTAASVIATAASNINPSTIMQTVDDQLQRAGFDLKSLVKAVDLSTLGLLTLVIIGGVLLFDLLSFGYLSYYDRNTSSYTSYGRSLVTNAAKFWDSREQYGLNDLVRGSRGLDSVTPILDSLADAILKFEGEDNTPTNSSRQSKEMKNI